MIRTLSSFKVYKINPFRSRANFLARGDKCIHSGHAGDTQQPYRTLDESD